MPIIVDKEFSDYGIFTGGRVSVIDRERANRRLMNPLELAILNLTPEKKDTEMQFMRLLSNSPLPINITLIEISPLRCPDGLVKFRKKFAEAEKQRFDGMIITGNPDDNVAFTRTHYWKETEDILDWTNSNVNSVLFVSWAAQAAMYHFYNIKKHSLKDKCFGIFTHRRILDGVSEPLMRGISDEFTMPHSRNSAIYSKDIMYAMDLKILAYSKRAGASIIKSTDNRRIFVTGHMEYERFTLKEEYEQGVKKGLKIKPPANYFTDDEMQEVRMNWASTANLFYQNWLNYCVYQPCCVPAEKEA